MGFSGVENIQDYGADLLYRKYVLAKIPDFLSNIYSSAFQNMVEETTIDHDKGDSSSMIRNYWVEEEEPGPARIDTWARYRIQSK